MQRDFVNFGKEKGIKINQNQMPLERAVFLFLLGGTGGSILQVALFLRPTPFNAPYVNSIKTYLFHALFYEWYGAALVSLPFYLILIFFVKKIKNKLFFNILSFAHLSCLFISLMLGQIDHELMRFMGIHISFDLINAYSGASGAPQAIWNAIAEDAGGRYSSILLFIVPVLFLGMALTVRRCLIWARTPFLWKFFIIAGGIALFYIAPFVSRSDYFAGKNRQERVQPAVILFYNDLLELGAPEKKYEQMDEKIKLLQQWWAQASNGSWGFSSSQYPILKKYKGICKEQDRQWNIILVVLETFRAMDMKSFNPLSKDAAPFLDSLAQSSKGAFWKRFVSNGQPTIVSFMTIHTSVPPHSQYIVAKKLTMNKFSSLPSLLRGRDYYTAFYSAPDPDWDNQTPWLSKWYDRIYFDKADKGVDRAVFRQASAFLKHSRPEGKPFLLTIFSNSNHLPFDSPEPDLDFVHSSELRDKINNTMRYTDDVVREFIESIKDEAWFKDTIVVVTGDHAYDLGERGVAQGHTNIRHETNWVPLIIASDNPLQPKGEQVTVGSHIDIAPTLAEMVGICDDNSFMGHSLLQGGNENAFAVNFKNGNMGIEEKDFSAFFPFNDKPSLYRNADFLQTTDVAREFLSTARDYEEKAKTISEVTDFLLEKNYIAP